jgi:hypothetical protein
MSAGAEPNAPTEPTPRGCGCHVCRWYRDHPNGVAMSVKLDRMTASWQASKSKG